MFEHLTFETILERMLAGVREGAPELDCREGSLIYTALAPAAIELQLMAIEMDAVLRESFADTQSRPYLVKRAAERGIAAKEATKAVRKGEFDTDDISVGTRFMLNELVFTVTERLDEMVFALECETAGDCGNTGTGDLEPLGYIPGLSQAKLTGILSHGTEAETAEQLQRRYVLSLKALAFGGNVADYLQTVGAIPGVGGVKVSPAWRGGGTVLLTITDAGSNSPAEGLTEEVQKKIHPPIGHEVTVRGAEAVAVAIAADFVFRPGFSFEQLKPQLEAAAEDYLTGLRDSWADEEGLVVRVSGLEQRFLGVPGVLDVTGTSLNGTAKNMTLGAFELPVLGSVIHA